MPEIILSDFSGGMNASVAVDKLSDKECLLAENVRFDEQGNVLISGANTAQNTSALLGGAVHSLFFDQALGGVAGVGTNIYFGKLLSVLGTSTATTNPKSTKMSFGAAPNRVYMDIGGVGYFKDTSISDLVTVDWAPPSASSAITTGPNTGTFNTNTSDNKIGTGTGYGFSLGTANNMQGVACTVVATSTLVIDNADGFHSQSGTATTTVSAKLIVGGVLVGTATSKTITQSWSVGPNGAFTTTEVSTFTFGNASTLWGYPTLTPAQVSSANFGFLFSASIRDPSGIGVDTPGVSLGGPTTCTAYQAAVGFVAGTGTTGTLTGTYTWKITFGAIGGEESGASIDSTSVILSGKQGTLTAIPTGDIRTSSRNIYRKGGLLTAYYLVGSIPDNVTTTFSDNQSDIAALTEAIILPGDTIGDEPNTRLGNQNVKYPTYHYDRVFWANGNTLIWSKPLNGFAYPADFETPVGDSKDITGILSLGGELIIFKPDGIYRLTGTDEDSFQLSKTLSAVGTDWPFTIVAAGGSTSGFYFTGRIIFANRQGIWVFNGYNSSKISQKLDLWFRQDDKTGTAIHGTNGFHVPEIVSSSVTNAYQAAASASFYRLAYAEANRIQNNAMLVLDLERGHISKRPFAAGSIAVDSVSGYAYAGSQNGFIVQLDDWNATGDGLGNPVNMDFQTKYNDLKLRGSKFAVWGLEFLINTSGQSVTPFIYFDEGTGPSESLAAITTSGAQRIFRKLNGSSSRSCRNFSVRLNASTSAVNSNGIPSIQVNHIKVYFEPRQARARTGEG